LVDLQLRLQIEPWVKSASVQRSWPDGLLIEVNEEKPIARWADDAFISNEGAVIVIDENVSLSHLPRLAGPLNESLAITRTYLEMTELFASRKLVLTGVNVDETMAWSISLKNGIEIVFGQYDVLTKLRNFLLVYDTNLQPDIGRVKRVDMRYESGMAVAWRLD
jgi:Cell division septal protein